MEIQKIFSEDNGEERLYSVLLDDIEMELFSEFQKEYARKDYEGLTNSEKEILRKKRGSYAKSLKKTYDDLKKGSNDLDYKFDTATATGSVSGGGVQTRFEVNTPRNGRKAEAFKKAHDSAVTDVLLGESKKAKEIMRKESFKPGHDWNVKHREVGDLIGNYRKDTKDFKSEVGRYHRNGKINEDLKARTEAYKIKKAEKAAERAAQSQASIARHAEKAKSLKKLRNIKRGAAGVAIGAGALGVGYGIHKALKKKNKDNE